MIITVVKPPSATPDIFCPSAMAPRTTDTISMTTPKNVTICIGAAENDVMLEMAYLVRAFTDHLD